jgi:nucleoside-specific outer membrane channel protein Tsx
MKTIRTLALAAVAAGALAAGTAVLAQDAKKDEPKQSAPHARGEHRGHAMGGMQERCHDGAQTHAAEHAGK